MDIDLYVAEMAALDLGCVVLSFQKYSPRFLLVQVQVDDPDWDDDGEVLYLKVSRRLH